MNMWSAFFFGLAVFNFGFCVFYAAERKYGLVVWNSFISGLTTFIACYKMIPN
jgi:hypothetical protein